LYLEDDGKYVVTGSALALQKSLSGSKTYGAPIKQKSRLGDGIFRSAWKSLTERSGKSCGSGC
jgi:hypothetical protein